MDAVSIDSVCLTPGWILPYIGYIGMCGPKGYGFSAVLVMNRVLILPDFGHLVINRVWFLHSNLDLGVSKTKTSKAKTLRP